MCEYVCGECICSSVCMQASESQSVNISCVIFGCKSLHAHVFTLFVLSGNLGAHAAPVSDSITSSSDLQRLVNRNKLFRRDTNAAQRRPCKITVTTASYMIVGLKINPFIMAECACTDTVYFPLTFTGIKSKYPS